jgi:hypothetical protein
MFIHTKQFIHEFTVEEVDSIIFYRTQPRMELPKDTIRIYAVVKVTLNISDTIVDQGQSFTLIHSLLPAHATNPNVTWSSSNTNTATVAGGVVTAASAGFATITVTTEDGNHTATCEIEVLAVTLPWQTQLGMASFVTNQTWTISNGTITQTWSDAVQTDSCSSKTTFNGGNWVTSQYRVDCRNNPNGKGDLFSFQAAAISQPHLQLCQHPWRVPTRQDFINLDIALGGNGSSRTDYVFFYENYIGRWGADLGGSCNGSGVLAGQGTGTNLWRYYWSSSVADWNEGYSLFLRSDGHSWPANGWLGMENGFAIRCVK